MNLKKSLLLIAVILVIDQISKIYIKTHFELGDSTEVFNWFKIHFIENSGAAWGAKLSDFLPISESSGKLILTVFRLFAVAGIGYWLYDTIRKVSPKVHMAQSHVARPPSWTQESQFPLLYKFRSGYYWKVIVFNLLKKLTIFTAWLFVEGRRKVTTLFGGCCCVTLQTCLCCVTHSRRVCCDDQQIVF